MSAGGHLPAAARPLLLNVDDNEVALYAKSRLLRHAGYQVIEARSGEEALDLVAGQAPTLVILDVKLPDMSGFEVCRRVKDSRPQILVLQTSASFVEGRDRVRGLEGGADGYLTQPIEPEEMLASVRALLRIRAAETALRESEAHLLAVLASATDYAIISLNSDGLVTGWNTGASTIFDWQAEEVLGRHIEFIYNPEDRCHRVAQSELEAARAQGRVEDKRWHVRKGGLQFFANGVMTRLDGVPAGGFVKILRDQTDQQRAAEAMQALNAQLEQRVAERTREIEAANHRLLAEMREREETEAKLRQSQKMEVIGQLTGGIAHDFNNLLQIITGNLEIILRQLPSEAARMKRSAENAMTGAKRAATLTQRLLAFSRLQPLAPRLLDVNELITGMSDLLRRALGETIELEIILAGDVWAVEADAGELESAILNLAVNARDAIGQGGKLKIETVNARLDESDPRLDVEVVPGQYVVICVTDTGVGMDRETLSHAFEPFFTTKDIGKGTGLGLSMVYGFVKQSGGHVRLHSELGFGTTVKIYLPRKIGAVSEAVSGAADAVPEGTRAYTILVVEDDDDVRAYSVEVLRELGYRVLEAYDGPAALRLLGRAEGGAVNLLFTDVVLPGEITGERLATLAREVRPDLKILFTTGYTRDAAFVSPSAVRGVHLIRKPFSYFDLAAKVRDALASGDELRA